MRDTRGRKAVEWRPFEEAREWVRNLKLNSFRDYRRYIKGDFKELPKLPDDIPKTPNSAYQYLSDWKGFSDWLGSPSISPRIRSRIQNGYSDIDNEMYYKVHIRLPRQYEDILKEDAFINLRSITKQVEFILINHFENKGKE